MRRECSGYGIAIATVGDEAVGTCSAAEVGAHRKAAEGYDSAMLFVLALRDWLWRKIGTFSHQDKSNRTVFC